MKTPQDYMIATKHFRISFLTTRLFRIEKKTFCDEMTQVIINRKNQENFMIDVSFLNTNLEIKTKDIKVTIDQYGKVLSIYLIQSNQLVCEFKKGNLKGTARTLDGSNGAVQLSDGVISRDGVAILDDSKSLLLVHNRLMPREECSDLYYFAYGQDYRGALKAFYQLTGEVPLIPRFALGNWWSRYHAYSDLEYKNLILKFEQNKIPLNVSVIDMDWHYVEIAKDFYNPKVPLKNLAYYDGWTGYTWNKKLFPNYQEFLSFLHEHHLKVTLNIHPSLGVRDYEEMFPQMAKAMGIKDLNTQIIPFDISSEKFIKNYLEVLHHPYEQDGVDFWWIDWQQGVESKMKDLDPLWALNHYHYQDNDRLDHRPLILSRFSGPGSHRYPLGFSGDTMMSWKSLKFQPYFTATAANIGYVWWSHDIGGHMCGIKDDELYLRWLQLGVFSPINRLHSTSNEFTGKEPWKYHYSTNKIATFYLQLRKRLIPYLYSMNYQTYRNGRALVEPMYYTYHQEEAYHVKNQFLFGSELLVAPITKKTNRTTLLAKTKVFLPKGRWMDIFTNQIYEGEQVLDLYRDLAYIPVLAKQGAIIPMYVDGESNNIDNEQDLEILIYHGNNEFELYEDDGESKEYLNAKYSLRKIIIEENQDRIKLTIKKNSNPLYKKNFKRHFLLSFKDICSANIQSSCAVQQIEDLAIDYLQLKVADCIEDIMIELSQCRFKENLNLKEAMIQLISSYQMENDFKTTLFTPLLEDTHAKVDLKENLLGPIEELRKMKY